MFTVRLYYCHTYIVFSWYEWFFFFFWQQFSNKLPKNCVACSVQFFALFFRMYQARNPGVNINLILALADSLLLCVLQEPLPDPNVPHIQALLSRLEVKQNQLKEKNAPHPTPP